MMSEQERDRLELEASREAVHTAQIAAVQTDAAAAQIHRSSSEIQTIVDRNGYVDRFRRIIGGVA